MLAIPAQCNARGVDRFDRAHGYKNRETDALGHVVSYVNDSQGRVTSQSTTRSVTEADGSTHTETLLTVYTLDDKGRVTSTTHPDGSVTTTEYNGIDKPVRECDALQRCTATQYTARGEVERIDYPDGTFEAKTYDPNGNLQSQTDRAGRTTGFEYDAANRLTRTIHPDPASDDGNDSNNPVGESRYDAAGRLLEAIDENGHVTAYRYDDANRRTQVIHSATASAGTAATLDEYDAAGRRSASTDALGNRTEYRYDAAGRLIETLHPDALGDDGNPANNPRSRAEYDAAGRKTADIDPAGTRGRQELRWLARCQQHRLCTRERQHPGCSPGCRVRRPGTCPRLPGAGPSQPGR